MLLYNMIQILLVALDVGVPVPALDDELNLEVDKMTNHCLNGFGQHWKPFLVGNKQTGRNICFYSWGSKYCTSE